MSTALVVLSGGQDSTTCLYWAKANFDVIESIAFNYGQRHAIELQSASTVAQLAGVAKHHVLDIRNLLSSRSPLVEHDRPLERYACFTTMERIVGDKIENTFVPMRNSVFLTMAANVAVSRDIFNLVTGVCQQDNANYPDCTLQFIDSQQATINKALGIDNFCIHTPLMHLSKKETVLLANSLDGCWDAMAYTHTCYDGKVPPCGNCHSCLLRAHGFAEAGMIDPLVERTTEANA